MTVKLRLLRESFFVTDGQTILWVIIKIGWFFYYCMLDLIDSNLETWSRIYVFLIIFKSRALEGWTRWKNEEDEFEHFNLFCLEFLK